MTLFATPRALSNARRIGSVVALGTLAAMPVGGTRSALRFFGPTAEAPVGSSPVAERAATSSLSLSLSTTFLGGGRPLAVGATLL